MQFNTLIASLERYINDILGSVIPGGIFILGLLFIDKNSGWSFGWPEGSSAWAALAWGAAAFLIGHIFAELFRLNENWVRSLTNYFLRQPPAHDGLGGKHIFGAWLASRFQYGAEQTIDEVSMRGIAHGISNAGSEISTRFRFLSLLFSGASVALVIAAILGLSASFGDYMGAARPASSLLIGSSMAAILAPFVLIPRSLYFAQLADEVPFESALAELLIDKDKFGIDDGKISFGGLVPEAPGSPNHNKSVAGGGQNGT